MKPRSFGEGLGIALVFNFILLIVFFKLFDIRKTYGEDSGIFFLVFVIASLVGSFAWANDLKGEKLSRTCDNINKFVEILTIRLAEIGYSLESRTDSLITFTPPWFTFTPPWFAFLAGRIYVIPKATGVEIVGPTMFMKKLRPTLES